MIARNCSAIEMKGVFFYGQCKCLSLQGLDMESSPLAWEGKYMKNASNQKKFTNIKNPKDPLGRRFHVNFNMKG